MVNKANMRLWVAALRSGQYEQGKHGLKTLHRSGSFRHCCLGVACEVALGAGVYLREDRIHHHAYVSFDNELTSLPRSVARWLGLEGDYQDPMLDQVDGQPVTCMNANDSRCWDFDQIADALTAYYELDQEDAPAAQA